MATTTKDKRPAPHSCGWCAPSWGQETDQCQDKKPYHCKGSYRNAVPASVSEDRIWHCPCAEAGHPGRKTTERKEALSHE